MSDQFVAEIRMYGFNFAPYQWALCNGQILPISQNTTMFSLIGTYYGGNGTSNFQLPNLQGTVPLGTGQGNGLSSYMIGEQGGVPSITLLDSEIPSHTHNLVADSDLASTISPAGAVYRRGEIPGNPAVGVGAYSSTTPANTALHPLALGTAGGNTAHNNMMPYLTMNFCIAMFGMYPPRG